MRLASALPFVVLLAAQSSAVEDEHPFILWTPSEAGAQRERVEQEPWAAEQWAAAAREKRSCDDLVDLFRFSVMGDKTLARQKRSCCSIRYMAARRKATTSRPCDTIPDCHVRLHHGALIETTKEKSVR